jgi:hypothetical protein
MPVLGRYSKTIEIAAIRGAERCGVTFAAPAVTPISQMLAQSYAFPAASCQIPDRNSMTI